MTSAGWYPDPTDERVMRYWNGVEWKSERVLTAPAPVAAPTNEVPTTQASALQTFAERFPMTRTSWFLFSGVALAAISVLMPWEHDTMGLASISRGPTSSAGGAALLFVLLGLVAWIAWPSRTHHLSKKRQVALAVLTTVLGLFVIAKFGALAHANAQAKAQSASENAAFGISDPTAMSYGPGFGLFVYTAGILAIAVGVAQAWFGRVRGNVAG